MNIEFDGVIQYEGVNWFLIDKKIKYNFYQTINLINMYTWSFVSSCVYNIYFKCKISYLNIINLSWYMLTRKIAELVKCHFSTTMFRDLAILKPNEK